MCFPASDVAAKLFQDSSNRLLIFTVIIQFSQVTNTFRDKQRCICVVEQTEKLQLSLSICEDDEIIFTSFPKEFDQAASRQVQHMFEEIEKELYEGRGGGAGILQGLQDECQQWATRFPHLRYFTQFSTNLLTFCSSIYCGCVSGLWGPRWCVPGMRASSGTLLQTRAAWRTCPQPEGGARRKRAVESKSQCVPIRSSLNHVLLRLCFVRATL